MFSKLLIANRGEIACRVIRTARRMGISTVAVYSDADADALHVAMADEAYRIGKPPPRESYLNIPAITDAARRAGAQAVHPGYGFLSENADFAEACAAAGLIFVGPPPAAIRAMGSKAEAKALMQRSGVPLVPGYHGDAQDLPTLSREAGRVGFPVLIKASAGGGGKGMRVVERAENLASAIAAAQREALSAFGDDRVLIERYLQNPRHIEIQIFADTQGNVVSLFERDCSIQRRHQKIIEEAPAPGMTETLRRQMGEAAIAAARAVGYVGAGTVEFIVAAEKFHFMEMNTRLQVEHPVTEAITGTDLVEWQLRVAAGEPLPMRQEELSVTGHAIELRLYAEDPARDYLPSTGTLAHLRFGPARIDTGVREGDRITSHYDPMIAKLIVHDNDRAAALAQLSAALARCAVVGVQTNLSLLRGIVGTPEFRAGAVDTSFLSRHPELPPPLHASDRAIAAAAMTLLEQPAGDDPWSATDCWRLNATGFRNIVLRHADETIDLQATPAGPHAWQLQWNTRTRHLRAGAENLLHMDGATCRIPVIAQADTLTAIVDGDAHAFTVLDPLAPPEAESAGAGRVIAPIPGRIAEVLVRLGDAVMRGQKLVVLEAMKMELALVAGTDGVVTALRCAAGDLVSEGVELVEIAPPEYAAPQRTT